ncbi:MAG: hypothetical protein ACKOC5_06700, partial [Chloroflexota bacterium]
GYLDHALGSAGLAAQVDLVSEYHLNADEPTALDYNTDYKTIAQQASLYAPDAFRAADHDPVVIDLALGQLDTYADDDLLCGGSSPCYANPDEAISHAAASGTVYVFPGSYNRLRLDRGAAVQLAAGVRLETFIQTAGSLLAPTGLLTVTGSFTHTAGAFEPNGGTLVLGGSGLQTIWGKTTFNNLRVNNPAGAALAGPTTLDGALQLERGRLELGEYDLLLGPAASIGGSPSAANMVTTSGAGLLRKHFSAPGAFTFPLGDAAGAVEFTPLSLTCSAVSGAGMVGAGVTNAVHPANPPAPRLARYWTLTQSGLSAFTCSGSFDYTDADLELDGQPESSLHAARYDQGQWSAGPAVDGPANRLTLALDAFGSVSALGISAPPVTLQADPRFLALRLRWQYSGAAPAGFNVYRAASLDGVRQKRNAALLPTSQIEDGWFYFDDFAASPGVAYYYWVEVVPTAGQAVLSQPLAVPPGYNLFLPLSRRP